MPYKDGEYFEFLEQPKAEVKKPQVKLVGTDGNVFALAGIVSKALKAAGQREKASEFMTKLFACESYSAALFLMTEYVEVS
jgi:hypothetical protein